MTRKESGLTTYKQTHRCEICGCPLSIVSGDCPHSDRHVYIPTEEEIAAACAEIRAANLGKLRSQVSPPMGFRDRATTKVGTARKLSTVESV